MALWEIGLQIAERLWRRGGKKCTTKNISSILLMEIQGRKRCWGRCLLIFHPDLRDYPTNKNGFFLIAQWHNVPFLNTDTLLEVYTRHACNFKEAGAGNVFPQSVYMCQHKPGAGYTRGESVEEEEGKKKKKTG